MSHMSLPGIQHFCLEELVDPRYIERFGSNAMWFVDQAMALCLDRLSNDVGGILVNNWHIGGSYSESGVRWPATTTGAEFSQHKFKNAFDLKPQRMTVQQLYLHVMANHAKYPQITTIENPEKTRTWLHVDGRWHDGDGILLVEP